MTNIDQFESLFKSAERPQFSLTDVLLDSILVVSDGDQAAAEHLKNRVLAFLGPALPGDVTWNLIDGGSRGSVSELLVKIETIQPQLICTHRNLDMPANEFPYSLGVYVDILTQATTTPVLLMPQQSDDVAVKKVMAITDHLTGDHQLVSYATKLAPIDGALILAHIEGETSFERFIAAISKIPDIDTDTARETILAQLLKEPHEFIASCREVLKEAGRKVRIDEIITLGHRLKDYYKHIEEQDVDLLVMNTKDDDQLAMHGLAYPLVVELRDTPMFLV